MEGVPVIRLASVHVGRPRAYIDAEGRPWRTAIRKESADGAVHLRALGLDGDGVADTRHHGGLHQAVLAYSRSHRDDWKARLDLDIPPGGLGENFSIEGLDDETVCVGDLFRVGSVQVQVSQPRQPCNTLARYWKCPKLLPEIWSTARSGWYFRVLEEGTVRGGEPLLLIERPHPGWSVARVLRALRDMKICPGEARAASELDHLTPAWRERLSAT